MSHPGCRETRKARVYVRGRAQWAGAERRKSISQVATTRYLLTVEGAILIVPIPIKPQIPMKIYVLTTFKYLTMCSRILSLVLRKTPLLNSTIRLSILFASDTHVYHP